MSIKLPFPGCQQSLKKYNQLLKRLKDYFFHSTELKITSSQTIEAYTEIYNLINQAPQKKMQNQKKYQMYQTTLFGFFKNDLTSFCKQIRQNLLANKGTSSPHDQLCFYYEWFVHYTWFLRWAHKILSSIQKNNGIFSRTSLFFTGLTTMRDEIVQPLYQDIFRLVMQNLQLFKQNRLQQHIQLQLIIQLIGMCGFSKCFSVRLQKNDLGFYSFMSINKQTNQKNQSQYENDYFKRRFLNQYVKYLKRKYVKLAEQMIQLSTPEYVNKVTQYLQKQTKAAQFFYSNEDVAKIVIRSIEQTLIANRCKQLIYNEKSGVSAMIQSENIDGLKFLYKLTKRTSQQKIFGQCYQENIEKYITEEIMNKLSAEEQKAAKKQTVTAVINTLFEFYVKIERITKQIMQFLKDPYDLTLVTCHLNGFQLACNKTNTICTFLVFYCDSSLKKQTNAADLNSKQLIVKISKMLKFLYSLDQFLKIYQKMLGIRILYDQFKNKQLEMQVINMLKNQVGIATLAKITAMVQDYKFSENFNSQKATIFRNNIPFNFQITLLTSGQWPIQDLKSSKKLVPAQILRAVQVFQFQYNQLFPGRQITWIFNYGRAIVQVRLDDQTKALLLLNNYQLLILLLLQRRDFQPLKILQVLSEVKPEDEPSFMASIMMLVKKGVLKKQGSSVKIQSKNQMISMNFGLKLKAPKLGCFQVPRFIQKLPTVNTQLNAQRGFIIQANIIKLMKTKRVLRYQDIINQVTIMCKTFKAQTAMVKNQIQNCIHKEYLQRDPKQFNTLIYKP